MKQKTKIITVVIFGMMIYASFASAALVPCGTKASGADCTIGDLFQAVILIINYLLGMAGLVAIVFIFIGGARMVFAAANPDQAKIGKETLYNAIFGFIMVVAAFLIMNIVLQFLMGSSADTCNSMFKFWSKDVKC